MIIDNKMLKELADLSRLQISDNNRSTLATDLNKIISYFDILNKIDLIEAEQIDSIQHTDFRDDDNLPSYNRKEILQNAKAKSQQMFIIPKAID